MELETPYLIIGYGKSATIALFTFIVVLPFLWLLNKICRNVRMWRNMISGFFFNSPIRAIVETYLDVCILSFLNLLNIKFTNFSRVAATVTVMGVTIYVILVPFLLMNIIFYNRPIIKTRKFKDKFGVLTEDLRRQRISQLYFYPIFCF